MFNNPPSSNGPPPILGVGLSVSPIKKLLLLLKPEQSDILAIIAFSVTIGLLQLATPIAVQAIVNAVAFGGLVQPLVVISLLLMLALGFAAALYCIQTWTVELLQRRLFVRLVADLSARLPRVKIEAYDGGHGPELVNRFFDIITIQKAAPKLLIDALGMALSVIVGLAVLAVYHPLLLLFDVFLLISIVIIIIIPLRRGERTAIEESSAKYEVAGWLEEIVRNPKTFRTGGAQQWIFEKSDTLTRNWIKARKLHFRTLFSQIISAQALYVFASVALLGLGGWLVLRGSLSIGQLVAAELIVSGIVYSVSKSDKYIETWYDLMAAVYKVGNLLDVHIERMDGETSLSNKSKGNLLEFTDVSWQNAREKNLLSTINIDIKTGERVGIAGPTGSGKSALIELLWRLREPTTGIIRFSGRDLRDLALDTLRAEIAIVSAVEIVHGTLSENVSLNRDSITRDDVRRAIASVGLDFAVAESPDRFDTMLHPLGGILSEGELQRLMLARAIAGKPTILVVDTLFDKETTETRQTIFDTLFSDEHNWTLLIASNLPEVLERCDHVVELSAGNTDKSRVKKSSSDVKEQEEGSSS